MKVYTKAEFDCHCLESTKLDLVDYNFQGFDEVSRNLNKLFDFSCKSINFSSGVRLLLCDELITCDHNVANEHNSNRVLTSKFYLSGHHGVVSPNIENVAAEYIEKASQNYLMYLPNIEEIEQFFTNPLKKIVIRLDLNFIHSFVSQLDSIPQQLQPLIEKDNPPNLHRPVGKVTPMMKSIIKQMWNHPYQGAIARMYLEGKTLELLAMQLAQLAESDLCSARSALKPKNIDPIYEARNILSEQLENPPSILELAEQVGVSDRTLRRGFRKIFNTTIIGYLNQLRMEKAEILLRTGKLSVTEVANKVGYSHLSHFTAAFKHQFGITPSECLKGKLGRQ